MRKYFFLFLFLSACSSDSKSDKPDYPFSFSIKTLNKSSYQKKRSDLIIAQQIKTSIDTNANIDTSNVEAGADGGVENMKDQLKESSFFTAQPEEVNINDDSIAKVNPGADTGTDIDTGVDIVQKTDDRALQEFTGFHVRDNLFQKEICEGFSKADWTNQDLSIKQSIQHFTGKQMENLLGINREFPSPKDKEDSIRCFVNTAFTLNNIFEITTDHWRESVQAPLQASHKETSIEFIEHYFVTWVGYGLLSPVKSIPSDRINFVVEEPRLLKNKQYRVATNFNIMNIHSTEIIWIVDAQSFPKELAFLDILVEGVSILYLLRNQMHYLFQKKHGDMSAVAFDLQNKMDDSSFADL